MGEWLNGGRSGWLRLMFRGGGFGVVMEPGVGTCIVISERGAVYFLKGKNRKSCRLVCKVSLRCGIIVPNTALRRNIVPRFDSTRSTVML